MPMSVSRSGRCGRYVPDFVLFRLLESSFFFNSVATYISKSAIQLLQVRVHGPLKNADFVKARRTPIPHDPPTIQGPANRNHHLKHNIPLSVLRGRTSPSTEHAIPGAHPDHPVGRALEPLRHAEEVWHLLQLRTHTKINGRRGNA